MSKTSNVFGARARREKHTTETTTKATKDRGPFVSQVSHSVKSVRDLRGDRVPSTWCEQRARIVRRMPVCAARAEPGAPFATSGSASAAAAVAVYADSGRRARPPPAPPMAGVSDCFTLGSTVWCRTCHNKEIEGEVMAFDLQTKILILSILSNNNPTNKFSLPLFRASFSCYLCLYCMCQACFCFP